MRKRALVSVIFFLIYSPVILIAQENESETAVSVIESSFDACAGSVKQIVQNAAGTLLAVSDENSITVYKAQTFEPIEKFYDGELSRFYFYSEGENEFLAVITDNGQFVVRKLVDLDGDWFFEQGDPYYSADCSDVSGRKKLTAVSISSNSDYVAAAFNDNSVQVHFRLRTTASSISHTIKAHRTPVFGLEFSRNGEYLATVSTDGEAYIWNSYTTSRIAHLKGIYARARVPVCFTDDSVYIVSLDSRNSFRISDFSGNTLYSILTGRPITAIKPLKDPDLLAIRNDKNEVMVYSISARRPVSMATAVREESKDAVFTSFEFDASSDLMYAGFSDGKVCLTEPVPYLDDTSMLVTDAALAGKGEGNFIHQKFSSISACGGTSYMTKPYLLSANIRGEYLYSEAISPFFVGGGLNLGIGFPRKDFPVDYKIRRQEVSAPKLLYATIYVPAGYAFSPWNNEMRILTTFKAGAKVSSLALFVDHGYIIGEPAFSFFMSIGAGMQIKWFTFDLNCEYDTLGKVSPSLYAGYVFRFGEKK
jgi:hypothetical protein